MTAVLENFTNAGTNRTPEEYRASLQTAQNAVKAYIDTFNGQVDERIVGKEEG